MLKTTTYVQTLASRLLSGEGDASINPFRINPGLNIEVINHGVNDRGEPSIVCPAGTAATVCDTRVRLDVVKKVADLSATGIVASAHALAYIDWEPSLRAEDDERGSLRLGEVFLHSPSGRDRISRNNLVLEEINLKERLATDVEVHALETDTLWALAMGVVTGVREGWVMRDEAALTCPHTEPQALLGDMDDTHILILLVHPGRIQAVLTLRPQRTYPEQ